MLCILWDAQDAIVITRITIYRRRRGSLLTFITPKKTIMYSQNDAMENVSPASNMATCLYIFGESMLKCLGIFNLLETFQKPLHSGKLT